MARIRTIKPEFFKNEELAELPAMVRLLFVGLWTQADREGRVEDRPKRLKAELFPYDNFDVNKGLDELQVSGFIIRYKVNANISDRILAPEQPVATINCIQVLNFCKHQKIDKINEKPSQLPEYQEHNSVVYEKSIDSLLKVGERKGKEGKGRERKLSADAVTTPISETKSTPKNSEEKKEKKLSAQKKETTEHWQPLVDVWFNFYEKNYQSKPTFSGPPTKAMKNIVDNLKRRSLERNKGWDERTATNTFTVFLEFAVQRAWLKENFRLENINSQFDQIVSDATGTTTGKPNAGASTNSRGEIPEQTRRELAAEMAIIASAGPSFTGGDSW